MLYSSYSESSVLVNSAVRESSIGLQSALKNHCAKVSMAHQAGGQMGLSVNQKRQLLVLAGYHCPLESYYLGNRYVYSQSMVRKPYLCLNLEASRSYTFLTKP
jgi:hypothetical protein